MAYPPPSAKRFRRQTRLQRAAADKLMMQSVVKKVLGFLAEWKKAIDILCVESNWMVSAEIEGQPQTIEWVGDGSPLEILKTAVGRFNAQMSGGAQSDVADSAQSVPAVAESDPGVEQSAESLGKGLQPNGGVGEGDLGEIQPQRKEVAING